MSDDEWNQFCDDIDGTMKLLNGMVDILVVAGVLMILSLFVSIDTALLGRIGGNLIVIFVAPCIASMNYCRLVVYANSVSRQSKDDIAEICVQITSMQSDLNFELLYDGDTHTDFLTVHYIQVSLKEHHVTIPVGAANSNTTLAGETGTVTDRVSEAPGDGSNSGAAELDDADRLVYLAGMVK
jgi:hypothetical protein